MNLNKYKTLIDATTNLRKKGFRRSYQLNTEDIIDLKTKKKYLAKELSIVEFHRFEGKRKPFRVNTIIAIECKDKNKGLLIVSHENQLDMKLVNFMGKVKIKVREIAAASR